MPTAPLRTQKGVRTTELKSESCKERAVHQAPSRILAHLFLALLLEASETPAIAAFMPLFFRASLPVFLLLQASQVGCTAQNMSDEREAQEESEALRASSSAEASGLAWARAHDNHCLRQHLTEALEANLARRDRYAALSDGRTRKLSSTMIGMDRIGLMFADKLDAAGVEVRGRSGVNIVCELVPSMARAKAVPEKRSARLSTPYRSLLLPEMRRTLRALSDAHDWSGLSAQARAYAEAPGDLASQHCFTRQAFLTLARLGDVVQEHDTADADAFGEKAVSAMLPMTRFSALADGMAAASQANGVPILCADMPILPTF